jgi:hypothetical protein
MEIKTEKGIITITKEQGSRLINIIILTFASGGVVGIVSLLMHPKEAWVPMEINLIMLVLNIVGVTVCFCQLVKDTVTYKAFETKTETETETE